MNNYYSKISRRATEGLIDFVIVFALILGYMVLMVKIWAPANTDSAESNWFFIPMIVIWLAYFPVTEGLTGQTIGKKITGSRVVKETGRDITIWDAFVRHVFDSIDFGLVGFLVMNSSAKKQRLGDLIAKTIVIENKAAVCNHCHLEIILDTKELMTGHFVCPACNHDNVGFQLTC